MRRRDKALALGGFAWVGDHQSASWVHWIGEGGARVVLAMGTGWRTPGF